MPAAPCTSLESLGLRQLRVPGLCPSLTWARLPQATSCALQNWRFQIGAPPKSPLAPVAPVPSSASLKAANASLELASPTPRDKCLRSRTLQGLGSAASMPCTIMYSTAKTPDQLHSSAKDFGFSTLDPIIVTSCVRMDGEKAGKGSSQCWLELLWREAALTKHRSAKGAKSSRAAECVNIAETSVQRSQQVSKTTPIGDLCIA